MVLSLFQNACILIAFMSVIHHFLRDKKIFQSLSLKTKVIIGFSGGILGLILLINSVHITPNIIIDFRYIPILLSALYGGFMPSIIASCIIGIFRLFFLGISEASINGLITALVVGVGFGSIALLKSSKKSKWIYSMLFLIATYLFHRGSHYKI